MSMKLIVDDIRIRSDQNGYPIVDGYFYLTVEERCFPAPDWFDLISADLEDWIPKLLSFANGHTDTCSLDFVDGPYRVLLIRDSAGEVYVTCYEDNRKVINKKAIHLPEFLISFAKGLRTLATAFYHQENTAQNADLISELGRVSKEFQTIANH